MNKTETKKLLNTIKGYYNSLFYIDEYVLNAWSDDYKNYDLEDGIEHLKTYLKEYPDIPPKPHTFKRGLLTPEEKRKIKERDYSVNCNLCNKLMQLDQYDNHYDKCLSTKYLIKRIEEEKGVVPEDDEIYYLPKEKFNGLYQKYFKRVI